MELNEDKLHLLQTELAFKKAGYELMNSQRDILNEYFEKINNQGLNSKIQKFKNAKLTTKG